jgi:hypothetical protein
MKEVECERCRSKRAWVTRRERACQPLSQFERDRREEIRAYDRQVRQRRRQREAWITEWYERHRPEITQQDEQTIDNSVRALEVIWRFAADMEWLRENSETLYEDDQTIDSLMTALEVIRRYAAGMRIPVQVVKTVYEPCVPLIRRRMQL